MRSLLTLLIAVCSLTAFCQVEYGTIIYLRTSEVVWQPDNEDGVETPHDKQIRQMMEKMQASGAFNQEYQATFAPGAFNCIEVPKEPAEASTENGDMVIVVQTGNEEPSHYYTNTEDGTILNTDYIYDRQFLVSGQPAPIEWELTGEKVPPSEMTAGLDLLIATGVSETGDTLIAGYAPSLPVEVGPLNYHGLPGAIITLEIPREKEKTVYRATGIQLSAEPVSVEMPTEGKEVTLEKFREQRKKKQKAVRRTFSH